MGCTFELYEVSTGLRAVRADRLCGAHAVLTGEVTDEAKGSGQASDVDIVVSMSEKMLELKRKEAQRRLR